MVSLSVFVESHSGQDNMPLSKKFFSKLHKAQQTLLHIILTVILIINQKNICKYIYLIMLLLRKLLLKQNVNIFNFV